MASLVVGRAGFEPCLEGEAAAHGWRPGEALACPGWMLAEPGAADPSPPAPPGGWCFASRWVDDVRVVPGGGGSARQAGRTAAAWFGEALRGELVRDPWVLETLAAPGLPGATAWARTARESTLEHLRARLGRVARLAGDPPPGTGRRTGLLVARPDRDRVMVGRTWHDGGQTRMADAPGAPSRSFLKLEEAFHVLGRAPQAGETVVDLGAAPGGWSFAAARRGARVEAVDNGPLKGAAASHPLIRHRREDGFRFRPAVPADWLLCDMVEDPWRVLTLLADWLAADLCRRLVANLKFGRADPLALLAAVRDPARGLSAPDRHVLARHLYHDREEFSVLVLPR